MTRRLDTIYNLIENGRGIIDVGTDHGYIPVKLAKSGYTGKIFASDINELPLKAAILNAENENVSDRIEFRITDGLKGFRKKDADTVIICGMGGDLIAKIIDDCAFLERSDIKLILQPMTKPEILRYYLINNGWKINKEIIVRENGKLFQILSVKYTGVFIGSLMNKNISLTDAELFTGQYENIRDSEYFSDIIDSFEARLSKKLKSKDSSFYKMIINQLDSMRLRHG